jgi:hypothetical protein
MERCPNCGAAARPAAKFCTTCGYQFVETTDSVNAEAAEAAATTNVSSESESPTVAVNDGWPATPDVSSSERNESWPAQPTTTDASGETATEGAANTWSAFAPNPWPARPGDASDGQDEAASPVVTTPEEELAGEVDSRASVAIAEAHSRAVRLLDELRASINTLGGGPDLSGVISDLEVALTPPGALQPDDLATLREALHTARQRPRDIDTVVDLTRRVDAIAALMIAYDRAIAAIERSLDTLRATEGRQGETVGEARDAEAGDGEKE